ncbi:hypothetical protein [Amphritea pacifica]|uniref:hypothetical protein n=1 Tax=Amphritea pacifica TaxID=2811233 RepID=UPI001966041B|nr:hypothetical protein [Amphritea pacifica]MBN1005107.1 hypothetical protein [Amphritea pacifica]
MDEPEKFRTLCERVGLALMMGQKVQYGLSFYYSVFHIKRSGWSEEKARDSIDSYLSKPMGHIVNAIEKDAPLDSKIFDGIVLLKKNRNWLVHDFDEESTPFISKGQKIDEYIELMDNIIKHSEIIVAALDEIGEELVPVRI